MGTAQRTGPATATLPRRTRFTVIPPTLTLALSRLRQTWRLLLVTQLGVLAAVTLMCVIPLFSQVAMSAGLRLALEGQANPLQTFGPVPFVGSGNTQLTQEQVELYTSAPTPDLIQQASQRVDQIMQAHLGRYLSGPGVFSLSTEAFPLVPGATSIDPGGTGGQLSLVAADPSQAAAHATVLSGTLPAAGSTDLQIALSPDTAAALHADVGSHVKLRLGIPLAPGQPGVATGQIITLDVVGIFTPQDVGTFWGGQDFAPHVYGPNVSYGAMASTSAMLAILPPLVGDTQPGSSFDPNKGFFSGAFDFTWTYTLDPDRLSANDLSTLSDQNNAMRQDVFRLQAEVPGVSNAFPHGALDALDGYRSRVIGVMVPITVLMIQVIGLVLLFVQLMANILAERQAEAIAILHSRGAHRRQILSALVVQGLGISVIAAIAGPLVAIPLVRLVAEWLLPASSQDALDVIGGNPLQVVQSILIFALIGAVGAMIAVVVSLLRAANMNVLVLRRDSARERGKSFVQRFNLDLVFAVLAAAAYGLYSLALASLGPSARTGLSALAIVWPIFLLIAGALVFLRLFPLLLRLGAWLSSRGSGASSTLALSQLARTPRQSTRMILLLALTTAFAIFSLIFTASQAQRLIDVTSFRVGADFSGTPPAALASSVADPVPDLTGRYGSIQGVSSATVGYVTDAQLREARGGGNVHIMAVDAATYADTALWNPTYSSQSPRSLMALLASSSSSATDSGTDSDVAPAVVDDALAAAFQVGVGGKFSVNPPGYDNGNEMRFVVAAVVHHIPTVYDSADDPFQSGMLVDYTTFASIYKNDLSTAAPALNTVWLKTGDDSQSLGSVRQELNDGTLAVTNLQDRRQMLESMQGDPLQLNLLGTLLVGTTTALALALLGGWIASWLSARSRLTNFAVLRALGTTPRQVLQVLLWEYGVVYVTALGLGLLLGWVLSSAALPSLVFANALEQNGPFDVPATRMVVPGGELVLAIGGLALLCAAAIGVMTFVLSRSSLGATLRLNQD